MQKTSFTLHPLLVALMLMVAGLISPSNGVDEGKKSDPLTMIAVAFSVIFVVMLAYIIAKKTKDLRLRKVDETRQVPSLK